MFFLVTITVRCPPGTTLVGEGQCALLPPRPMIYERAVEHCQSKGGSLLYIESEAENMAVKAMLAAFNAQAPQPYKYFLIGKYYLIAKIIMFKY